MKIKETSEGHNLSKTFIINAYYSWLCDLIGLRQLDRSYFLLIKDLYNKPFSWFIPNDDNRACEGKNLRDQFCDENNYPYIYEYFDEECSMLELIIGLAYRCEGIMIDENFSISMKDWFWRLIENIGLIECTDEYYINYCASKSVDMILDKVINRGYLRSGKGGFFPLKHPKEDQRKVDLWYQMSAYLVENYYIEDAAV